jgi:ribose transport system substrate-binding protein
MKKAFVVGLCFVLILMSMTACNGKKSSKAAVAAGVPKIYCIAPVGTDVFVELKTGFDTAIKELGWEGHYVGDPIASTTLEGLVNYCETALTDNADGIMSMFVVPDVFIDFADRARQKGTLVSGINTQLSQDISNFMVGTDPPGMGVAQADALVDIAGGKTVSVVYIQSQLADTGQNIVFDAFKKKLEAYPNITVHSQQECNGDSIKAAETIAALIKASPEINAVVCMDGGATLGLANYVEENGIGPSFYAVGTDYSDEIFDYIRAGYLDCSMVQDFYKMGYNSVYLMKDILDGKSVSFSNDSGMRRIKAENIDAFITERKL